MEIMQASSELAVSNAISIDPDVLIDKFKWTLSSMTNCENLIDWHCIACQTD